MLIAEMFSAFQYDALKRHFLPEFGTREIKTIPKKTFCLITFFFGQGAHPDALDAEAVRLRPLREGLRPQVLPLQARGILLHAPHQAKQAGNGRLNKRWILPIFARCLAVELRGA